MRECRAETQNSLRSTFQQDSSSRNDVDNWPYQWLIKRCNSHRFIGTGTALASNRISYHFDLNGPSITIDTACSGSLVAVHEACKAIRSGEIHQALVGGTNLILDPEEIAVMSSMQYVGEYLFVSDLRAKAELEFCLTMAAATLLTIEPMDSVEAKAWWRLS